MPDRGENNQNAPAGRFCDAGPTIDRPGAAGETNHQPFAPWPDRQISRQKQPKRVHVPEVKKRIKTVRICSRRSPAVAEIVARFTPSS